MVPLAARFGPAPQWPLFLLFGFNKAIPTEQGQKGATEELGLDTFR